jgi:hypothetical protein
VLTCRARIDSHFLVPEARDTTEPKTGDESHYGEHPGSVLNAANALKRLKQSMQSAIDQRRPIRVASVPRRIEPTAMPKSAALAMKPALVALTPVSFMIDGNEMPTMARS